MWKVWTAALAMVLLMACAPQAKKKQYVLKGKVEAVDVTGKTLTVNHQKVDGWMDAMTMAYSVHDPAVLAQVQPGDQIEATVYEDDYLLYNVKITGKNR
jgi:Cu/Ag efflux protein CusF